MEARTVKRRWVQSGCGWVERRRVVTCVGGHVGRVVEGRDSDATWRRCCTDEAWLPRLLRDGIEDMRRPEPAWPQLSRRRRILKLEVASLFPPSERRAGIREASAGVSWRTAIGVHSMRVMASASVQAVSLCWPRQAWPTFLFRRPLVTLDSRPPSPRKKSIFGGCIPPRKTSRDAWPSSTPSSPATVRATPVRETPG
jgi:hypothetical protein